VDAETLQAYERNAVELCANYRWKDPRPVYDLLLGFFHRGQPTLHVGSCSGRDVAWLDSAGESEFSSRSSYILAAQRSELHTIEVILSMKRRANACPYSRPAEPAMTCPYHVANCISAASTAVLRRDRWAFRQAYPTAKVTLTRRRCD
jgi:hypothetical protein